MNNNIEKSDYCNYVEKTFSNSHIFKKSPSLQSIPENKLLLENDNADSSIIVEKKSQKEERILLHIESFKND